MSNVYRDQVVEVQAAPLFDFCSACGAEESPAHLCTTTAEKNGGKLLPEAPLPVFKKLIRLVHNEPLHTETQQERKGQSDSRLIRFYIRTKNKELLPAEVNSRRILFKKENQPVGGADENIYKHKICTVRTVNHTSSFNPILHMDTFVALTIFLVRMGSILLSSQGSFVDNVNSKPDSL